MLGKFCSQYLDVADPVGAKVAVISAQLAPADKDAAVFKVAQHHRPDDALGDFAFSLWYVS